MKLPILGKFSRSSREFHPKFHPYFWNSRILEYFKTAGMFGGGSFKPLPQTVRTQGAESLWRRVTDLEIPAVIPFQKSGLF